MHRLGPLRGLAFLLGLGVAIAIAGAAVRPGGALEAVGGWSTGGTNHFESANPPAGDGYELELVSVFPKCDSPQLVAGFDDQGLPLVSASHLTDTRPERALSARLFDSQGDTLVVLDGRWAVCPTGASRPDPELLIWWPETWYQRVHESRIEGHEIDRFVWNYSHSIKLARPDAFEHALETAAAGDSLCFYTRLLAAVPGEDERLRIEVDPLYTGEGGIAFTDGDRHLAVIKTDGGYHNVDTFYMLFDQEDLASGGDYPLISISDIEGGYRGIFCVDLDSGETLWKARMGASPARPHVADLDGDGIDEIIVQCYSPENGVSGTGMTDAGTSYVICLDLSGNILWKKRFVGVHIGAMAGVADVTGDGRNEVVTVCSSARFMDMGYASVLSPNGRTIAQSSDLGGLYGLVVADFDGDGTSEIVAGAPDSSVVMLDGNLEVVAGFTDTVSFRRVPNWFNKRMVVPDIRELELGYLHQRVMPLAAFDVDGDGDIETIALSTAWANVRWSAHERATLTPPRGDIVVLNSRMEEEARLIIRGDDSDLRRVPFDAPASLKIDAYPVDMDGDGTRELLVSNGARGLFVLRVKPEGSESG